MSSLERERRLGVGDGLDEDIGIDLTAMAITRAIFSH